MLLISLAVALRGREQTPPQEMENHIEESATIFGLIHFHLKCLFFSGNF